MSENNKQMQEQIIELETKISYQEDLLQELNNHIITQQAQIEKLNTLCDILKDQFKEVMSSLPDASSGNEVPPHY